MNSWLKRINRIVKAYDPGLYAGVNSQGVPCVFHRKQAVERHDCDGLVIWQYVNRPDFVFALTDTWFLTGAPVEWGTEPVLAKLGACDLARRDIFREFNDSTDKLAKSKKRDFSNKLEAWAYDFRDAFREETKDINTALIKNDKEFEKRKEDFYGNC